MDRRSALWGIAVAGVAIVLVVAGLAAAHVGPFRSSPASDAPAPAFNLTGIYGHTFSLSSYRGSDVVLIEFTSLSCSECKIVEETLKSLYAGYNATGTTKVQFISIYIQPTTVDTTSALRSWHSQNNITWFMAQDDPDLTVSHAYGVPPSPIPVVAIVDPSGHLVYDSYGAQDSGTLRSTISSAQAGTAAAISVVTVGVFALASIAGVTTFFSPCAFPMFPGYMSLYLGLDAQRAAGASAAANEVAYRGAARRALAAGSVSAFGMLVVFLVIGLGLILAANAISRYIPDLMVVVGVALIGLGALLMTNLQYWRIVTPIQAAWRRIAGDGGAAPGDPASAGRGFYAKLFGYGMGYAAAAAGCVAPVIFSAIIAGLALGLVMGIASILVFSLTAALLMVGVTVLLAIAGTRYMNQLKAFTPVIKKISAGALVLVGLYLLYFFYTAWGFAIPSL